MEIGGVERALLGLLDALGSMNNVEVDLMIGNHKGEFMTLVPSSIRILPQRSDYAALERPIKDVIKERHFIIAICRLFAKFVHSRYLKTLADSERPCDESIYQYAARFTTPVLGDLQKLGEYDLAISFLQPHNIVRDKVKARKKICWVHTDYSTIVVNAGIELPVWDAYNNIICVSEDVREAFGDKFPTLNHKLIVMENILSSSTILANSIREDASEQIPKKEGQLNFLSIGRFSPVKRFECIPSMSRILLDLGLKFKWYIIGYGDEREIRNNIKSNQVEDTVILLGKKTNPYPYIAATDIYIQPSLYEGKSIAVREAQILCKPVVICAYPTSSSQVTQEIDGVIVPMEVEECAKRIYKLACDDALQSRIIGHLKAKIYTNEDEIKKIKDLLI